MLPRGAYLWGWSGVGGLEWVGGDERVKDVVEWVGMAEEGEGKDIQEIEGNGLIPRVSVFDGCLDDVGHRANGHFVEIQQRRGRGL